MNVRQLNAWFCRYRTNCLAAVASCTGEERAKQNEVRAAFERVAQSFASYPEDEQVTRRLINNVCDQLSVYQRHVFMEAVSYLLCKTSEDYNKARANIADLKKLARMVDDHG